MSRIYLKLGSDAERLRRSLEALASARGFFWGNSPNISALVREIADLADAAPAETLAALEIAAECAAGGDWDELIEIIRPATSPRNI